MLSSLTSKEINMRSNLLLLLIPATLKELELKPKTVDLGVRLFDYYCLKKSEVKKKQESCKIKGLKRTKGAENLVL